MFLCRYVLSCAGYFSPQVFPSTSFLLEICLQDFFSEITHNPLKRQMVVPKITPTFAQYSFFVRIVKDRNSLPNHLFNDEINVNKFKKGLKRWMKIYWHSRSYFNCIYFHFVFGRTLTSTKISPIHRGFQFSFFFFFGNYLFASLYNSQFSLAMGLCSFALRARSPKLHYDTRPNWTIGSSVTN